MEDCLLGPSAQAIDLVRHSRPLDFPLAPLARLELPSRAPRTSLSRASRPPLARLARDSSGTLKSRLEKRVGAWGERLVVGSVAARAARRPSPSPLGGASGRRATTVRAPLPVGYLPKVWPKAKTPRRANRVTTLILHLTILRDVFSPRTSEAPLCAPPTSLARSSPCSCSAAHPRPVRLRPAVHVHCLSPACVMLAQQPL